MFSALPLAEALKFNNLSGATNVSFQLNPCECMFRNASTLSSSLCIAHCLVLFFPSDSSILTFHGFLDVCCVCVGLAFFSLELLFFICSFV